MKDMNEPVVAVERPDAIAGTARGNGVDRRTMLKAAVAAGTIAGTWVAPRIETFGFTAAGASTPCVLLNPVAQDMPSNCGQSYTPIADGPDVTGVACGNSGKDTPVNNCSQSFGDAGKIDRFTFTDPITGCNEIVIRTIALDCHPAGQLPPPAPLDNGTNPERNPDVGQFALIIERTDGAGCSQCRILEGVLVASSGRAELMTLNNGPVDCPPPPNDGLNTGNIGDGVNVSIPCNNMLLASSARLAVRLFCEIDDGVCTPQG